MRFENFQQLFSIVVFRHQETLGNFLSSVEMAPRKRKAAEPKPQESAQTEISEAEQWRIIQDTGLLKELPKGQELQLDPVVDDEGTPLADEVFNALLLIIPFSFLLTLMEM